MSGEDGSRLHHSTGPLVSIALVLQTVAAGAVLMAQVWSAGAVRGTASQGRR
ncbi:hypothetical protein [Streptomyces alboniger]|uniref:hypothetical protein n=1 Tax=Streptomyces alboniger TaxID=132473 RepID=UPI00142ED50D|nr:hypothetical protein [Streptomyces alboniger]